MTLPAPSKRKRWYERAIQTVYDHLVVPFLQTHDKLNRVAWGAAIGMFTGLTPTVGVQMYLVTMLWALCRYVFRLRFNLTIAVSMVWITNPVTTIPIYYLFLKTGDLLLGALVYEVRTMTFAVFRAEVAQLGAGQQLDWLHWILYATQVLWVEFGWPIVMGSLVYAVPLGLLAYPFTRVTLKRYRRYLA
ncbi:MAG TPA: DUF2062 domain-containing protein, partial [bacterium]